MRHSAEMLVCSTQLFSRSHPRKHPADPPEHLERSVGLRPSGGRPTRSRACFVITGGAEGVNWGLNPSTATFTCSRGLMQYSCTGA